MINDLNSQIEFFRKLELRSAKSNYKVNILVAFIFVLIFSIGIKDYFVLAFLFLFFVCVSLITAGYAKSVICIKKNNPPVALGIVYATEDPTVVYPESRKSYFVFSIDTNGCWVKDYVEYDFEKHELQCPFVTFANNKLIASSNYVPKTIDALFKRDTLLAAPKELINVLRKYQYVKQGVPK